MNGKRKIIVIVAFLIISFGLITYGATRGQGKINVTFIDGYNDKLIDKQTIKPGEDAVVPESPKHENFVFDGWYGSKDKLITDFKNILKDLKVEARYKADKNKNGIADDKDTYYTVRFIDGFTNGILKTESVLVGLGASAPTVPAHTNYEFTGWNKDYSNVQGNLDVTAVYKRVVENQVLTPETPATVYFNLKFYDKNGEVFETQKVEENKDSASVTAPVYEGYTFKGWFLKNDEEYKIGSKVTSDLDIYGKWTLNTYEVRLNTKDGKFEEESKLTEEQILNHNDAITLPNLKKNYTLTYHKNGSYAEIIGSDKIVLPVEFLGWCETDTDTCGKLLLPGTVLTVTGDVEYFAVWGTTKDIKLTKALRLPSESKTYEFTGWSTTADGSKEYNAAAKINLKSNLDLYAVWKEINKEYIVIFAGKISNDETKNPDKLKMSQEIEYGKEIVLPEGEELNYTLTYDAKGGILSSGSAKVVLPVTFKGWCKNSVFCSDLNLIKALDTTTITGYTLFTPRYSNYSEKTTIVSASKEDKEYVYEFVGWSLTKNGKANPKYAPGTEIELNIFTSSLKLYAVYNKTPRTYSLTLDANGGTISDDFKTIYNYKELTETFPEPTKSYQLTYDANGGELSTSIYKSTASVEFLGWCEEGVDPCTEYVTSTLMTDDKAYIAVWGTAEEIELIGASKAASGNVSYEFDGWFLDTDTVYNAGDKITLTSNTTLQAMWKSIHTVEFVNNGKGVKPSDQTVAYGDSVTNPGDLSQTDYTFDGWYKDELFTNKWDFSTDIINADVVSSDGKVYLYAKWVKAITSVDSSNSPFQSVSAYLLDFSDTSLSLKSSYYSCNIIGTCTSQLGNNGIQIYSSSTDLDAKIFFGSHGYSSVGYSWPGNLWSSYYRADTSENYIYVLYTYGGYRYVIEYKRSSDLFPTYSINEFYKILS